MTAPEGVAARLDELARLHTAARNAPPWRRVGRAVFTSGKATPAVTGYEDDAALIVAAVNAVPGLVAAVRAVAELADALLHMQLQAVDDGTLEAADAYGTAAHRIDARLTSALSGRDDHTEEAGR